MSNNLLWIIPIVTVVSIFARLYKAKFSYFDKKGLIMLLAGTLLVGYSEELLVRGIAVTALQQAGYSVILTGIFRFSYLGCFIL